MLADSNHHRGKARSRATRTGSLLRPRWAIAAVLCALTACKPNVDLGKWSCAEDGGDSPIPDAGAAIAVPWSTGFENRFCDYSELAGFCYGDSSAVYQLVTSPVHSGRYAAAFRVDSSDAGYQARCVRQGILPTAAYYGAWYYVPALAVNSANWNLLHFTGGDDLSDPRTLSGWLDVSLVNENDGLHVAVFGANYAEIGNAMTSPLVPIETWFHLQIYVKRAPTGSGELALYQDGQQLFDVTNVTTDNSSLGQWFVGNLATGLTPPESTLYVDDVTISATL